MSAFYIAPAKSRVYVATDTLCVRADDFTPLTFGHKSFAVPHLNTIVGVSGFGAFMAEWKAQLKFNCTEMDIADLHEVAPKMMRDAYHRFMLTATPAVEEVRGPGGTKVYHAGYSPRRGECVAYGYYSGDDFEGEEITSEYVQPISEEIQAVFTRDQGLVERIVAFFERVYELNQQSPPGESVAAVGGEVWLHTLVEGQIDTRRIHVYDNYEETAEAIAENDWNALQSTKDV